ncbi:MAG TPA: PEP-CTERM sorting domain-containing protein [Candidatus Didemnitutus sp.]
MKLLRFLALLASLVAFGARLPAQFVWTGNSTTDGSVQDATNWQPNTPQTPVGDGTETLTFDSLPGTQANILFPTMAVLDLDFNNVYSPLYTVSALSGTSTLTLDGNMSIGGNTVNFDSSVNIALSAGTHTISFPSGVLQMSLDGPISGPGALNFSGNSIITMNGANTYTGGTTIDGGEVILYGSIAHPTSDLILGQSVGAHFGMYGGATVSDNQGRIAIGTNSDSSVYVDGAGTTWNNAGYLYVGESGVANLSLTNGATVTSANTSVGNNTSGYGVLSISGSTLTQSGNLYVGGQGIGILEMVTNAFVSDVDGVIGNNIGGQGYVSMETSTWNNSGDLYVGSTWAGSLTLDYGSTVNATNLFIANDAGSSGTMTLNDAASILNVSSSLYVGNGGTGVLEVIGGAVNVGNGNGVIYLGNSAAGNGHLEIGDGSNGQGVINADAISAGAGIGVLYFQTTGTSGSPYYLTRDGTASGIPVLLDGSLIVVSNYGYNVLNGNNTYTGGTTIDDGSVLVAASNNALGTGSVTPFGPNSTLNVASGVTISNPIVTSVSGTLAGNGTFSTPIMLSDGMVVSPGDIIGNLTFSNGLTLGVNGKMEMEVKTAGGAAGTGYDVVNVSGGTLNITSSTASPFVIYLYSINLSGTAGAVADFNSSTGYSWVLFNSTSLTNFAANKFQIDTTNFANLLDGGAFSIVESGNQIVLDFSPVPEPSTFALLIPGLGLVAWAVRRRRRAA